MDANLNFVALDGEKININEYYEVEYWTKKLDTNTETLRNAVKHVGIAVEDVKNYLKK
jgi:hypothetical protein